MGQKVGWKRSVSSYRKNLLKKNPTTVLCMIYMILQLSMGGGSDASLLEMEKEFNGAVSAPSDFLVLRESGAVQIYEISHRTRNKTRKLGVV